MQASGCAGVDNGHGDEEDGWAGGTDDCEHKIDGCDIGGRAQMLHYLVSTWRKRL